MSAVSGGAVGEGGVGAGDGAVVSYGGVEGETGGDGGGASNSFTSCLFVVVLNINSCRLRSGAGGLCAPSLKTMVAERNVLRYCDLWLLC